jgi:hypothetical protein
MSWLAVVLALAPSVNVSVEPCAKVSEPELRHLLVLELLSTRASATGLTAKVECKGEALELRVEDPLSGKQLQRWVDLSRAMPDVRSRLLALAIVEVLEASWSEQLFPAPLDLTRASFEEDLSPTAQVTASGSPPVQLRDSKFQLTLVGSARAQLNVGLVEMGAGLRFVHLPFRYLGWAAEAVGESGSYDWGLSVGSTRLSSMTGALEVLGHLELGRVSLQLAGGARGGYAVAEVPHGPLESTTQPNGGWFGPYAAVSTSVAMGLFLLSARVEGGATVRGVPAHVWVFNTGMEGPWLGAMVGFGVRL